MTDAGAPYLPGKPIGYGMNPGMHHNVMTGQDDYAIPENPLDAPEPGAQPGPAPAAAAPPSPEAAPAPEVPHPFAPPVGSESKGPIVGWRVRDKEGHVVAELHNVNTNEWQKSQIDSVGKSLLDQAITPDDKESAQRARAYALSLVGIVPLEKITKTMLQLYENDQRNLTSRSIQAEKSKRAAMRGSGGPAGPTKAEKFENTVELEDAKFAESLLNSDQERAKVSVLNDDLSTLDKMEAMATSDNALSQRGSIAEYMKTLTGKQSTDAERNQILGAGGMIAKLESALNLWNPNDATMSKKYVKLFADNLRTVRAAVLKRKQAIGKAAAEHLKHNPRFMKKDQATKDQLGRYGEGVVTGDYGDASPPPPAAAPKGGGFDPDL